MHSVLRTCLAALASALLCGSASAQVLTFIASLSGAAESPPNASPATGSATVMLDLTAHTLFISANYSGLTGISSAAHIHAATASPFTGTAGVATTTPSFVGFPTGVTSGSFSTTLDMTQVPSYNASYVTANGGTTATAETALFNAIIGGRAYFNIHSFAFGGGEIRGFFVAVPEPSTYAAGAGALGLAAWVARRRRASALA